MRTSFKIAIAAIIATGAYFVTHNETPKEKEARHLARGNEYFANKDFQKARIEYRNAAKLMPSDPEISYRWGLVDEAEGDIRNAYANFILAEQQNPHFTEALLKIAHYQLIISQYAEVQKRITTILEDDKDNAEAHALKAALHLRRKEFADAKKEAEVAFAKESGNITATSVLTGLYISQGDIEKAEEVINTGIAKNPKEISLLLLKARIYEKPLNLEKINETYQEVIKLQPNDKQIRSMLAEMYMKSGKTEEAENIMRTAVRDLPEDFKLKQQLVVFLAKSKGTEAAEKEIQSYMQSYPDHSELYFWLAELYLNTNQKDKAIALLEQVASKDKNDKTDRESLMARSSLARINFRNGNKEVAEKLVNAVLEKSPTNAEALFVRASIATDTGSYQNAVTDLRNIIRNNPKDRDAHQLLAEVLLLQGYTDLAIETLSQLIEIQPQNPATQVRLAQMYQENKDPKHAMSILAKVTKTNPDYPIGWEATARIAIASNDMETAQKAIKRLQEFEGQEEVAQFLIGKIAQSGGKFIDAEKTYQDIIKKDPNSPMAERALFELTQRNHTNEELTNTAKFIVSLNTDSAYINTILGELLLALKRPEEAALAFDKAIANNSQLQDAYLNRANLYINDKKPEKAAELLTKAANINKNDARADLVLANIDLTNQDYDTAIKRYEEIIKRFPDLDLPINNFASLIADHKSTDKDMLQKAAKLAERFNTGKNQNFLDTLAWVNFRLDKLSQAESIMVRNASIGELTPSMHYHYGAILEKSGNKVKAKTELEKATVKDASPEVAKNASELLKKL